MVQNKVCKLWYKAVHVTIANTLKKELNHLQKKRNPDETKVRLLTWRIAYNLYFGGQYHEAFEMLVELCNTIDEVKSEEIASRSISFLNLTVARCAMRLYIETAHRSYLTLCYEYYHMGIDTMEYEVSIKVRLPSVLSELGKVLEHYGNFNAALEIYTNLITNFPSFRGFFQAMYRTAIVGKYMSESAG